MSTRLLFCLAISSIGVSYTFGQSQNASGGNQGVGIVGPLNVNNTNQVSVMPPGDGDTDPPIGNGNIPVTINFTMQGTQITGQLVYDTADYTVGQFLGNAVITGDCGNPNPAWSIAVSGGWSYGNWSVNSPNFNPCDPNWPDPNACNTVSSTTQSATKIFYFPNVPSPNKPYYMYLTYKYGYNTKSDYATFVGYRNPSDNTIMAEVVHQWSRTGTSADNYRFGPILLKGAPSFTGLAMTRSTYSRNDSLLFDNGQSCLWSAELYEALPNFTGTHTYNFSINVSGLKDGDEVDIPLPGLERVNISPTSLRLLNVQSKWVQEVKTLTKLVGKLTIQAAGGLAAYIAQSTASMSRLEPQASSIASSPVFYISDQTLFYKGSYPHLHVHVRAH